MGILHILLTHTPVLYWNSGAIQSKIHEQSPLIHFSLLSINSTSNMCENTSHVYEWKMLTQEKLLWIPYMVDLLAMNPLADKTDNNYMRYQVDYKKIKKHLTVEAYRWDNLSFEIYVFFLLLDKLLPQK